MCVRVNVRDNSITQYAGFQGNNSDTDDGCMFSMALYIVCSVYVCKVSIVQKLVIVSWSLQRAEVLIGRLACKVCLQ